MPRPHRTSLDPLWFGRGTIGEQTSVEDVYFADDEPSPIGVITDRLIDRLPEPDRTAVQAHLAGMSFSQIGDMLDRDKKTVWRWARRGLRRIAEAMVGTPWLRVMLEEYIDGLEPDAGGTVPGTLEDALERTLPKDA